MEKKCFDNTNIENVINIMSNNGVNSFTAYDFTIRKINNTYWLDTGKYIIIDGKITLKETIDTTIIISEKPAWYNGRIIVEY